MYLLDPTQAEVEAYMPSLTELVLLGGDRRYTFQLKIGKRCVTHHSCLAVISRMINLSVFENCMEILRNWAVVEKSATKTKWEGRNHQSISSNILEANNKSKLFLLRYVHCILLELELELEFRE